VFVDVEVFDVKEGNVEDEDEVVPPLFPVLAKANAVLLLFVVAADCVPEVLAVEDEVEGATPN
jgi:hypothetical protein